MNYRPIIITGILSALFFFLTGFNNLHSVIKPDESVLFYPSYAYQSPDGSIKCNIHGHIFEAEEDSIFRKGLIRSIMEGTEENDDEDNPYLSERIRPFLYDNEGGKSIRIVINGKEYPLDESGDNGHLKTALSLPNLKIKTGSFITYRAVTPPGDHRDFSGRSIFISERGISVISDIDDTIKESNVLDKKELLKNTFMRKFRAVKGMPEFYMELKSGGAAFHYVSGSPWQLYTPISQFISEEKFPEGTVHLKYIRAKDSSIIQFITADQLDFKVKNIEGILKDFPRRKFILIGDSGEFDPEVYTEIAARHKEQVKAVYIRDVNKPGDKAERYARLRGMNPEVKFRLFREPSELKSEAAGIR